MITLSNLLPQATTFPPIVFPQYQPQPPQMENGLVQYETPGLPTPPESTECSPEPCELPNYASFHIAIHRISKIPVQPDQPTTLHAVQRHKDQQHYYDVMQRELDVIHKRNSWILVSEDEVPRGQQILPVKWVFTLKQSPDTDNPPRYKARLVVRGDLQRDALYLALGRRRLLLSLH
jgi:hypothetical protein